MTEPYVYILVRQDIPVEQAVVQAGHAAYHAGLTFDKPHQVPRMVVLSVPDEVALTTAAERLSAHGVHHELFHEPDFGPMGYSALATRPLSQGHERRLFKKYPLYRASKEGVGQ